MITPNKWEEALKYVATLSNAEARSVLDDFSFWAQPHQQWPKGDWKAWICRAGRGTGKTFMGSKWTHYMARQKIKSGQMAVIGRTYKEVRDICVEGPSGILETSPAGFRPEYYPAKGLLIWPNGTVAKILSADQPDSFRGSQLYWAWCDEMAFWAYPRKTWKSCLFPALRTVKGSNISSKILITTTPLPDKFLRELEEGPNTVVTRSSTYDNLWLSEATLADYRAEYEGDPRTERQELYGEFVEQNESALWDYATICRNRISQEEYDEEIQGKNKINKVVVAVDPAGSSNEKSDETGIVVASIDDDGIFYVLDDISGRYKPEEWAKKACDAFSDYDCQLIIAETNYGGEMVRSTLETVDPYIPLQMVTARKAKRIRAEPISSLYAKNRVKHVGTFKKLEEQQTDWVPGDSSPDRLDALVYAITHLKEEASGMSLYTTDLSRFRKRRK